MSGPSYPLLCCSPPTQQWPLPNPYGSLNQNTTSRKQSSVVFTQPWPDSRFAPPKPVKPLHYSLFQYVGKEVIRKMLTGQDAPVFKQMIDKPTVFDRFRSLRQPRAPALKRFLEAFGANFDRSLVGKMRLDPKSPKYEIYRSWARGAMHYLAVRPNTLRDKIIEIRAVPQYTIKKAEAARKKPENVKR